MALHSRQQAWAAGFCAFKVVPRWTPLATRAPRVGPDSHRHIFLDGMSQRQNAELWGPGDSSLSDQKLIQ